MQEVKVFSESEFGNLSVIVRNGVNYVKLSDVMGSLGLSNITSVKSRLDKEGIIDVPRTSNEGDLSSQQFPR